MDCDVQILPGDWQQGGQAGRAGTTPGSGGQLLSNHQQGNFAFYAFFSGRFAICISEPYFLKYLFYRTRVRSLAMLVTHSLTNSLTNSLTAV